MIRKKLIFATLALITLVFLVPTVIWANSPKNIIFYIGDGMASTQRQVAEESKQVIQSFLVCLYVFQDTESEGPHRVDLIRAYGSPDRTHRRWTRF